MIEYGDNYSDTSGSLWQFKRDKVFANNNYFNIDNSKSSRYKAALEGKTTNAIKNTSSFIKDVKILFH